VACPDLIAPIKLEPASIAGTLELYEHVKGVRDSTQPDLQFLGVVATFFSETITNKKPRELLAEFTHLFADKMFATPIHASAVVSNAPAFGRPIVLLDPKSRSALEYTRLTEEVIARG
jgi:chromosome partitioning protein